MTGLVNYDYFDGAIRFNWVLLLLNFSLLIHFIVSLFFSYKKSGKIIDYWHFMILFFFVVPVLCMYPFNASIYNIISVGQAYYSIEPMVNLAYIVTITGYVSVWLGGWFARHRAAVTPGKFIAIVDSIIGIVFLKKRTIKIMALLMCICVVFFVLFQVKNGIFGDPRAFFMKNNVYRPIYNFMIASFKVLVIFLGLLVISKKNVGDLILLGILCSLGMFLGTRGAILDAILYVFLFFILAQGKIVKLWQIVCFGLLMLSAVFILGKFRSGGSNIGIFDFIAYGNTYSDTRDFAWVLAFWDYNYVFGKTYVAGLLSFIPAHFSDYREFWAISRYTNHFLGFDTSIHPGVRPGRFGEPFLNFGFVGVITVGLILGYWLRYASDSINNILSTEGKNGIVQAYARTVPAQLASYLCLTAGFFELYTWIMWVIVLFCINRYLLARTR